MSKLIAPLSFLVRQQRRNQKMMDLFQLQKSRTHTYKEKKRTINLASASLLFHIALPPIIPFADLLRPPPVRDQERPLEVLEFRPKVLDGYVQ